MKIRNVFRLKFLLFLPVAALITATVVIVTLLLINLSIDSIKRQNQQNLKHQVESIARMFERELAVKTERNLSNLKAAHEYLYREPLRFSGKMRTQNIVNQFDGQRFDTQMAEWYRGDELINENRTLIDNAVDVFGGTMTIFQRNDHGFVRISTNVIGDDGRPALYSFIPDTSVVARTLCQGEKYFGRAWVVNDWYLTAYEPIRHNDSIVGALYVGDQEKDLGALRSILQPVHIGNSGRAIVFDAKGRVIIGMPGDEEIFPFISGVGDSIVSFNQSGVNRTAAVQYFSPFDFHLCVVQDDDLETQGLTGRMIWHAALIMLVAIAALLLMLYFFTFDKFYRYVQELQQSRIALKSTEEALRQSEDRFGKLFDSTGDAIFVTDQSEAIVEVNQAACSGLGYTRTELLGMKMSEIKTPRYAALVSHNRQKIYELGTYTFESVHVSRDGREIPVEITSRVIDYNNDKLILSVARNIGERKESEREILSTVIRVEERERERFAKEMHDGLGPLLSTVKLYVNELKSAGISEEERNDFVRYVNELLDDSITSIKSIANNLMPRAIHQYGLIKALGSFCEKVHNSNRIAVDFTHEGFTERLDENSELIIFRIVSELINNTLKHAQAQNISISLRRAGSRVFLRFSDNGVGFDAEEIMKAENKGMGLKNITSRIRSVNGSFRINSEPGQGFSIEIEI